LLRNDFDHNDQWIEVRKQIKTWIERDLLIDLEKARKQERKRIKAAKDAAEALLASQATVDVSETVTTPVSTEASVSDSAQSAAETSKEEQEELEAEIKSLIEEIALRFSLTGRERLLLDALVKIVTAFVSLETMMNEVLPQVVNRLETKTTGND
jgi:hypothetical protein